MQIDFLTELFRKAKEKGVHTTLDTSGAPFTEEGSWFEKWKELMKYTDLVMLDIKQIDDEQHKILTGRTNRNILRMAEVLSDMGKPVWIRVVYRCRREAIKMNIFIGWQTLSTPPEKCGKSGGPAVSYLGSFQMGGSGYSLRSGRNQTSHKRAGGKCRADPRDQKIE